MTLLEAYRAAVKRPIEELPRLYLQCSPAGRRFFLRENLDGNEVCLVDEDAIDVDYRVTLTLHELMSDNWEVKLESGSL